MDVIENILRYVKLPKNSKSTDESFSPLCQLQMSISQNRPVQLVPCFVGVHHICSLYIDYGTIKNFLNLLPVSFSKQHRKGQVTEQSVGKIVDFF